MNVQDILLIYDYNYWANAKLLALSARVSQEQFTARASFPYGGLRGTLVHILEAEWGWRVRCQAAGYAGELFEAAFPDLTFLESRWREEEKLMRRYLAGLRDEDLNGHVVYQTYPPPGEKRDRILWHCLWHVVNHGTQHRSEAAALLTDHGQSPGDLDFTVYLTENKP